jgi:hypothetical protein
LVAVHARPLAQTRKRSCWLAGIFECRRGGAGHAGAPAAQSSAAGWTLCRVCGSVSWPLRRLVLCRLPGCKLLVVHIPHVLCSAALVPLRGGVSRARCRAVLVSTLATMYLCHASRREHASKTASSGHACTSTQAWGPDVCMHACTHAHRRGCPADACHMSLFAEAFCSAGMKPPCDLQLTACYCHVWLPIRGHPVTATLSWLPLRLHTSQPTANGCAQAALVLQVRRPSSHGRPSHRNSPAPPPSRRLHRAFREFSRGAIRHRQHCAPCPRPDWQPFPGRRIRHLCGGGCRCCGTRRA